MAGLVGAVGVPVQKHAAPEVKRERDPVLILLHSTAEKHVLDLQYLHRVVTHIIVQVRFDQILYLLFSKAFNTVFQQQILLMKRRLKVLVTTLIYVRIVLI